MNDALTDANGLGELFKNSGVIERKTDVILVQITLKTSVICTFYWGNLILF